MKNFLIITLSFVVLSGCTSKENLQLELESQKNSMLTELRDTIYNCEDDSYSYGILMDEGCLDDEFRYDGDFYNCELSRPNFMVIDGDCVLSRLR